MRAIPLKIIGVIRSPYKSLEEAPRQGKERKEASVLVFYDRKLARELRKDRKLRVLYWMHKAGRNVLWSEKRGRGIFATRSPERPNPIGAAVVEVLGWNEGKVLVRYLDAVDGTPVLKVFPLQRKAPAES